MYRYVGTDSEYIAMLVIHLFTDISSFILQYEFQKAAFNQTLKKQKQATAFSKGGGELLSSIDLLHNTVICDHQPKLAGIFSCP
jgi:hypothetical protein